MVSASPIRASPLPLPVGEGRLQRFDGLGGSAEWHIPVGPRLRGDDNHGNWRCTLYLAEY